MQARFKFRVWLKYAKFMYDISSFCYLNGLDKCVFHFENGSQKTLKTKDFELMQSTGLKDKNGKLIYEGDIVKINQDVIEKYQYDPYELEGFENENAVICYRQEQGRFTFEFDPKDNSGWNVKNLVDDYYYFLNWKPCGKLENNILAYIEIVGNAYENKELLKEN